jgi:hypothetical protein
MPMSTAKRSSARFTYPALAGGGSKSRRFHMLSR